VVPDVFDFCAVCTSGSRANFGNHHGNQSCKPVSPSKSCSPTKVVPEPKMGTTVGTTCAPQMPKWFPFRVSRNTDGTTHEVISSTLRRRFASQFVSHFLRSAFSIGEKELCVQNRSNTLYFHNGWSSQSQDKRWMSLGNPLKPHQTAPRGTRTGARRISGSQGT
jgi:hypothetical protein